MKTIEDLTIKQVKKEIIAWETSMGSEAKKVEVLSIGQHSTAQDGDSNIYMDGPDYTIPMEYFYANVVIDGEKKMRYYVWNCEDEDIYTGTDEDPQDDDEDEEEESPRTILAYWYDTMKDLVDDDHIVYSQDLMEYFGFIEGDYFHEYNPSHELQAILDEFYKKMDEAHAGGTTPMNMAHLLDETAAKIYAQAKKERGEG